MTCPSTWWFSLNFWNFVPFGTRYSVVNQLTLKIVYFILQLTLGILSSKEIYAFHYLIGLPLEFVLLTMGAH